MSRVNAEPVRFARPVVIRHGGRSRSVVSVSDVAAILLHDFKKETAKRKAAMDACLRVIRGEAPPPAARRAFVTAAIEAGILAGD